MSKKYGKVKEIETFVRNSTVKLVLLVVMLIVFLKQDIYSFVIFVVASLLGYIRFYCMMDMFSALVDKNAKISYWSILNYFLTFFITVMFFKRYCLGHDEVCIYCGVLGITIVSFGIIFGCISGEINKMSITKRR